MNYNEFVSQLKEELHKYLGKHVDIKLNQVIKNNDIHRDTFIMAEADNPVSPAMYLEDYYQLYKEGMELASIVEKMVNIYRQCRNHLPADVEWFRDFERMKEGIFCKVINLEHNRELLHKIPYIPYLDLAITFYYILQDEALGSGTVQICLSHLEMWGIEKESLYYTARKNTEKKLSCHLLEMKDVIREIMPEDPVDLPELPMYVLTNQKRYWGACGILYDHVLEETAEKVGGNFYILPSSVHECIIVPEEDALPQEQLEEMVREINRTQVLPEEVLSDRIYHYDCKKHHLVM